MSAKSSQFHQWCKRFKTPFFTLYFALIFLITFLMELEKTQYLYHSTTGGIFNDKKIICAAILTWICFGLTFTLLNLGVHDLLKSIYGIELQKKSFYKYLEKYIDHTFIFFWGIILYPLDKIFKPSTPILLITGEIILTILISILVLSMKDLLFV